MAATAVPVAGCRCRWLQEALAAEIGSEDPRNGELTVRLLEAPFVYDTDRAEADSWAM